MHIHGHRVGAETDVLAQIKIVDRFYQTDAAHLEKIVNVLPPVVEALDHAQNKPKVPVYELFPRRLVSLFDQYKQFFCFFMGYHR
jgi:hypothetical protein